MKNKTKILLPSLLLILLFTKYMIWDDNNRRWMIEDIYHKPDSGYKATVAPQISLMVRGSNNYSKALINDASKLQSTEAADYFLVSNKEQIIESVKKAKLEKKSISLSGARHSMGGQNLGSSIHLDMNGYDKVLNYDSIDQSVTVESGITWKLLQEFLGKENRAIRVMQDSNIFTVGGSMGSNVHGKDIRYGQLIESINWFKIINSSGIEIKVSRVENSELFGAVIGGFGGFGVITEVNLKTDPNVNYEYIITHQPAESLVQKWDEYIASGAEQVEGHFSVDKDNFLQDLQIYYFRQTDKNVKNTPLQRERHGEGDDVSGENSIWLRKLVYRLSRESDLGKKFRWWMQKNVSPIVDPGITTRNGSMAAPFRVLELDDPQTTDILQEYFVPRDKITEFLPKYRELLKSNNMNLINCGLRRVQVDTETMVNYSQQEMYGFVCYYNVSRDSSKNIDLKQFTGQMLDYMNTIDAKFYLAYNTEGHNDKILTMYPKLKDLQVLKTRNDPGEVFKNKFWDKLKTN
jgi:decaprenylphospho-beta-D-ribofuranose 2-oxidase